MSGGASCDIPCTLYFALCTLYNVVFCMKKPKLELHSFRTSDYADVLEQNPLVDERGKIHPPCSTGVIRVGRAKPLANPLSVSLCPKIILLTPCSTRFPVLALPLPWFLLEFSIRSTEYGGTWIIGTPHHIRSTSESVLNWAYKPKLNSDLTIWRSDDPNLIP